MKSASNIELVSPVTDRVPVKQTVSQERAKLSPRVRFPYSTNGEDTLLVFLSVDEEHILRTQENTSQ